CVYRRLLAIFILNYECHFSHVILPPLLTKHALPIVGQISLCDQELSSALLQHLACVFSQLCCYRLNKNSFCHAYSPSLSPIY
ncbi:hypothetical protein, partial [Proteus mirabilis]|uniref:hypothetical protein n=1 Tax=Proteus mirabilis TaxID=584 RepID=UPI003C7AEC71